MNRLFPRLKKTSLQNRLILIAIVFLILPTFIGQNAILFTSMQQLAGKQAVQTVHSELNTASNQINNLFSGLRSVSNLVAQDTGIERYIEDCRTLKESDALDQTISSPTSNPLSKYRSGIGEPSISMHLLTIDGLLINENSMHFRQPSSWQKLAPFVRTFQYPYRSPIVQNQELNALLGISDDCITLVKRANFNNKKGYWFLLSMPIRLLEKMLYPQLSSNQNLYIISNQSDLLLSIKQLNLSDEKILSANYQIYSQGIEHFAAGRESYLINYTTTPETHWTLVLVSNPHNFYRPVYQNYLKYACVSLLVALVLAFTLKKLIPKALRPLRSLADGMRSVISGNLDSRLAVSSQDEIGFLSKQFNIMLDAMKNMVNTIYNEQNKKRKTEIALLQNQINPHFLYNTLAAIRYLNMSNNLEDVDHMIRSLTIILRNTISNRNLWLPLTEELDITKQYLEIQDILSERAVHYDISVSAGAEDISVPKFILQPIIENSFMHGFQENKRTWYLRIKCQLKSEVLVIRVLDNGIGTAEKPYLESAEASAPIQKDKIGSSPAKSKESHIGLLNIDRRLTLLYGNHYTLNFQSKPGLGTMVEIKIPAERGELNV